jgi:RND family efflux transporter MFP subunit
MTVYRSQLQLPKWLIPLAAIGALLLVILLALGVLGGDKKTQPGNTETKAQALPGGASTYLISKQAAVNTLSWQGTVRSRLLVKIAPKVNARIVDIPVHPGDKLKKGEVIARLDDRELRAANHAAVAAQAAAQAQAEQAETEEKRITELFRKQAATRQSYDAVVAQSKAAQALANQAAGNAQKSQVMLGEDVLYAPFDGVVAERLQEPGDMGMPNQAIVSFLKPDELRLEAAISEQCMSSIKLGMQAPVRINAIQQTLNGNIDEIAPEWDSRTHTQLIKVALPKFTGLQHGQFGWLELACQSQQPAILIPVSAVVHYGQLQAVKVVVKGAWQIRHIRTGKQFGEQLEVLSGLQEGETILVDKEVTP